MNIILGNIISFLGSFIDFTFDLKYNEKSKILIGNLFSTSMSFISLLLLGAYDGVIGCVVTFLRLITIYFKDKYNKKLNILFILFIILYSSVFLNYMGLQTIIMFISVMLSFIPKWLFKDMQLIRLFTLLSLILIIIYNVMILNYGAIPIELASLFGLEITLFKWKKSTKKTR